MRIAVTIGRSLMQDSWPLVDAMMRGEEKPPQRVYAADLDAVRPTWATVAPQGSGALQYDFGSRSRALW